MQMLPIQKKRKQETVVITYWGTQFDLEAELDDPSTTDLVTFCVPHVSGVYRQTAIAWADTKHLVMEFLKEMEGPALPQLEWRMDNGNVQTLIETANPEIVWACVVIDVEVLYGSPPKLDAGELRERIGRDTARLAQLLDPKDPESILGELSRDAKKDAWKYLGEPEEPDIEF